MAHLFNTIHSRPIYLFGREHIIHTDKIFLLLNLEKGIIGPCKKSLNNTHNIRNNFKINPYAFVRVPISVLKTRKDEQRVVQF